MAALLQLFHSLPLCPELRLHRHQQRRQLQVHQHEVSRQQRPLPLPLASHPLPLQPWLQRPCLLQHPCLLRHPLLQHPSAAWPHRPWESCLLQAPADGAPATPAATPAAAAA